MARCVSFPTVVEQGMLFVWPDENSHELAAKTSPPITPGKQASSPGSFMQGDQCGV